MLLLSQVHCIYLYHTPGVGKLRPPKNLSLYMIKCQNYHNIAHGPQPTVAVRIQPATLGHQDEP